MQGIPGIFMIDKIKLVMSNKFDTCFIAKIYQIQSTTTYFKFLSRRDYERILRMDVHCLPARVNLAYNLQVVGKFWLSWQQFTAAININPGVLMYLI